MSCWCPLPSSAFSFLLSKRRFNDSNLIKHLTPEHTREVTAVDMDGLDAAAHSQLSKVVDEILRTERVYVVALEALSAVLQMLRPHLDGEVDLLVTANALHGVHRELLERLEIADGDMWGVSRAFALMTPFLRMYATYCGGYTRALARVAEVRRTTSAVSEFEGSRGEPLDSLLIRPVQRLCKYPLFFSELLRPLPANGGLRREFEVVAAAVRSVSAEVNAKAKGVVDVVRLVELHHELGGRLGALLAPTRTLLLEADVKVEHTRKLRPVRRTHKLLLLSDAVVLAQVRTPAAALLRSAERLSGILPTRLPRHRSERIDAGEDTSRKGCRAPLKLKAVLPLRSLTLRHAAALTRVSLRAAPDGGADWQLLMQCDDPEVSYHLKCADAIAACALIEAVDVARAKLLNSARQNSCRRSFLHFPNAAMSADAGIPPGATESLIASARGRRWSLVKRIGSSISSRRRRSASDAENAAAAAESAAPAGESEEALLDALVSSSDGESDGKGSASERESEND
jgi:hypothetical protein